MHYDVRTWTNHDFIQNRSLCQVLFRYCMSNRRLWEPIIRTTTVLYRQVTVVERSVNLYIMWSRHLLSTWVSTPPPDTNSGQQLSAAIGNMYASHVWCKALTIIQSKISLLLCEYQATQFSPCSQKYRINNLLSESTASSLIRVWLSSNL